LLRSFRSCRRMGTVPPGPFSAPSISSEKRGRVVCYESDPVLSWALGDGWNGDAGRGRGDATSLGLNGNPINDLAIGVNSGLDNVEACSLFMKY
jgi:hypothetical protein